MSYLLGLSGSLPRDATNTKLIHAAGASYGGAFQIGDLRLPLYDGDLEEESGIPAEVQALAAPAPRPPFFSWQVARI